jgi:Flp pilus assembly protein TadG
MEFLKTPSVVIRRSPRPARRGLATVEMALLTPILLVLTFAVIEYGWMFFKQQQITNATRAGARLAATPSATVGQVQARVDALLGPSGANITGYTTTVADINTVPGRTLSVTVSVPYSNITITHMTNPAMVIYLPAPATLSAKMVMGKEGP